MRIAALAGYQLCNLFPASQRRSFRTKGLEDLGMMSADGIGQKKPLKRSSTDVLLLDAVEHVAMDYHFDHHRAQQSRADMNGHRSLRSRADLVQPGPGLRAFCGNNEVVWCVELVVGLYLPANTIQIAHLMRPVGPAVQGRKIGQVSIRSRDHHQPCIDSSGALANFHRGIHASSIEQKNFDQAP